MQWPYHSSMYIPINIGKRSKLQGHHQMHNKIMSQKSQRNKYVVEITTEEKINNLAIYICKVAI